MATKVRRFKCAKLAAVREAMSGFKECFGISGTPDNPPVPMRCMLCGKVLNPGERYETEDGLRFHPGHAALYKERERAVAGKSGQARNDAYSEWTQKNQGRFEAFASQRGREIMQKLSELERAGRADGDPEYERLMKELVREEEQGMGQRIRGGAEAGHFADAARAFAACGSYDPDAPRLEGTGGGAMTVYQFNRQADWNTGHSDAVRGDPVRQGYGMNDDYMSGYRSGERDLREAKMYHPDDPQAARKAATKAGQPMQASSGGQFAGGEDDRSYSVVRDPATGMWGASTGGSGEMTRSEANSVASERNTRERSVRQNAREEIDLQRAIRANVGR